MDTPSPLIAAQRFGLGEPELAAVGTDARAWLLAQIGPADAQRGPSSAEGLQAQHDLAAERRRAKEDGAAARGPAALRLRDLVQGDVRARLATAAATRRPFAERLALFWANHFTVSVAKAPVRGLAGALEREAIRPHIAGPFETMLAAAVKHPAMLRYLDNEQSAGPQSPVVRRRLVRERISGEPARITGLNENLAREVLELHTLGVHGGYTQADVTQFARALTGWRTGAGATQVSFDAGWHDEGPKTVLGRRYAAGPQALDQVLHDLALHPSTARFIATKLARHFAADDPPPALVARLERTWLGTGGDLAAVSRALVEAPEPWAEGAAKLKTPEEFVVGSARLLRWGDAAFERVADGGIGTLGQRVQAAPSPAGWPDRAEEWLGPDAVWKRVEWATRAGARAARQADARAVAQAAFGSAFSDSSRRQIERAADGGQALALLLLSPEFQRR